MSVSALREALATASVDTSTMLERSELEAAYASLPNDQTRGAQAAPARDPVDPVRVFQERLRGEEAFWLRPPFKHNSDKYATLCRNDTCTQCGKKPKKVRGLSVKSLDKPSRAS